MTRRSAVATLAAMLVCLVTGACSSSAAPVPSSPSRPTVSTAAASSTTTTPRPAPNREGHVRPAHVVVVVEENRSAADILGNPDAAYLNRLAAGGAALTNFFAITHPSEPNYLALLSGSTQQLTDDSCPHRYRAPSLVGQVRRAGLTFAGYAEGLPNPGYLGCATGRYVRRHVPWTNFTDAPGAVNQPLPAFPTDYTRLPTVSFVIPNLDHDMHDGTIAQADAWLRRHLGGYATWARTHNSLLVVTWDEDDRSADNHIPTIISGATVRPGRYAERSDLYGLLRTVEWFYDLPPLGAAARRAPLTAMWTG